MWTETATLTRRSFASEDDLFVDFADNGGGDEEEEEDCNVENNNHDYYNDGDNYIDGADFV